MGGKARLTDSLAKKALSSLRSITRLLEKHGIHCCLESGTLLGIVRENRLLPWDNDLDLTVRSADADRLMRLKWILFLKGYRVRTAPVYQDYGPLKVGAPRLLKLKTWHLFSSARNRLLIDIFIKYPEDDRYYWSVGRSSIVNKSAPRHHFDRFESIQFDGTRYLVPSDVENYLTHRYGDWRTPVQEWDYKSDDQAAEASRRQVLP